MLQFNLFVKGGSAGWSVEDLLTPSLVLHQPHLTELLSIATEFTSISMGPQLKQENQMLV